MQTVDKFQRILDLMTRPGSPSASVSSSSGNNTQHRQVKIEPIAAALLRDYIEEVAHAVIEEAAMICKHRKGKHIEAKDINLILAKKLDLLVPGAKRPTIHDKHALKLHRLDNTYLVEEDELPPTTPMLVTGTTRMSTTEGKDSKDEKSPRESSAAAVDIPVAKRKGAKRKQQDTSSHPEATKKQAK